MRFLRDELVGLVGLAEAVVAALGAFGTLSGDQVKGLTGIFAALLLFGVRQAVVSPGTLAKATLDAATQTATNLGTTTVGKIGETTEVGLSVAADTVRGVLKDVGGLAGVLAPKPDTGGKS